MVIFHVDLDREEQFVAEIGRNNGASQVRLPATVPPGPTISARLSLRPLSSLRRMLLLELRRLCLRISPGSIGLSPLAFAKRLSISVKLTTPVRRPDMEAPGRAAAVTEDAA